MGQYLVVDIDQFQCMFSDFSSGGGNGCNGVAVIKRLVPCHDIFRLGNDIYRQNNALNLYVGQGREIIPAGNGKYTIERQGPAHVDGFNAGMGVWATQHFALDHPRRK